MVGIYSEDIFSLFVTWLKGIATGEKIYTLSDISRSTNDKHYNLLILGSSKAGSVHKPMSRSITVQLNSYSESENLARQKANTFFYNWLSEKYHILISVEKDLYLGQIKALDLPFSLGKSSNGLYQYVCNYEIFY